MMQIKDILDFLSEKQISFEFRGDKNLEVAGFSTLKNYRLNTVTWAKNELAYEFDFTDKLLVIAQQGLNVEAQNVIYSEQSKLAFFALVEHMAQKDEQKNIETVKIGIGTVIGDKVKLGRNVVIGNNCVIEGNVSIGDDTRIWNNVIIINNVVIGSSCEIQSSCVIGHDGFAWNETNDHKKNMIKHFGGIEIGDNVYIGPNTVIDRGEIDNTIIKGGVKIGAGCYIAHNVIVGENVIMITGSRLYGSVQISANAYIASATVRNQCKIGAAAFVGMGAVVTDHVPDGVVAVGIPAKILNRREEK